MTARIQNIDVLDLPADALIYSTNVILNCTGGVGACLLQRYGPHVQADLHQILKDQGTSYANQGDVFEHVSEGMPYQKVFHTIPCDGFYNTSAEIVESVMRESLTDCARTEAVRSVAMSVLATGYGHFPYSSFFRLAAAVLAAPEFDALGRTTICIEDGDSYGLAVEQIKAEGLALEVH